ncbi:MAG: ATP-binding protein [Gammaproteobacteria bacterium]
MPNTLMARTVILIAILIVVSQVAWFSIVRLLFIPPLRAAHANPIISTITLARSALESLPPAQRQPFLDSLAQGHGLHIVAASTPQAQFTGTNQQPPTELALSLRREFGPAILFKTQAVTNELWIRFPAGTQDYWLVVPRARFHTSFPLDLLVWVGLGVIIAILGAGLVVFRLNRQLHRVLEAARRLGHGEAPPKIEETGPEEIRDLSRGFNQMAEGLQRLDAERRLMLAGISHDLRTPLTRLRISIELAEAELESELRRGMIHDIDDMDSILVQFLDYARDGSEEAAQYADFNQIVFDVCHRYQATGTKIITQLDDCPNFHFRKLAMRRMISNLVDNAVRHGGTDIEVHTYTRASHLVFEVMDRGPGLRHLPPSEIVKPFVRDDSARGRHAGAGLGLSITERIVKLHAGTLTLANREAGGLSVTVTIPLGTLVARLPTPAKTVTPPMAQAETGTGRL